MRLVAEMEELRAIDWADIVVSLPNIKDHQ
jgi:hypothetical protein